MTGSHQTCRRNNDSGITGAPEFTPGLFILCVVATIGCILGSRSCIHHRPVGHDLLYLVKPEVLLRPFAGVPEGVEDN